MEKKETENTIETWKKKKGQLLHLSTKCMCDTCDGSAPMKGPQQSAHKRWKAETEISTTGTPGQLRARNAVMRSQVEIEENKMTAKMFSDGQETFAKGILFQKKRGLVYMRGLPS